MRISPTITTGARPMALSRAGINPVNQATLRTPATAKTAAIRTSRSRTRGWVGGDPGSGPDRSAVVGLDRDADRRNQDPSGEDAPGARAQPLLGPMEGDRQVGAHVRLGGRP